MAAPVTGPRELIVEDAVRGREFIHGAIAGGSGSGKTFTLLTLATYLAQGGLIIAIDSEKNQIAKYAKMFRFRKITLDTYSPERYIEAMYAAHKLNPAVLIIDGISQEWDGSGGCLEIVGGVATNWKTVTPRHTRFLDKIKAYPGHVLCSIRANMEYDFTQDEKKKMVITPLGVQPIQRKNLQYEFDFFGMLDQQHNLTVNKSVMTGFVDTNAVYPLPGKELASHMQAWCDDEGSAWDTAAND